MDEPIRVETVTTYEDYKSYSWFYALRRGPRLKASFVVMLVALAVAVAGFVFIAADIGFGWLMQHSGKYVVILLLLFPGYFLLLGFMFKLAYKRTSNLLGSLHRYEFFPNCVTIETQGASVSGRTEFKYDVFFRAFELEDAFYLYVNKMQAFILPKRYFEGAGAETLEAFFKEKLGSRFVKCYKEKNPQK
jgi:hypothetical protein